MFVIKEGTAPDKIGEGTDEATQKSITEFLSKKGYVVRTADQDKEYLTTQTQQGIDKVLGERNTQIEQTINKITGIQKNSGEKYYDYMERAVNEKLKEVSVLQGKIKEYETKGLDGSALAQQLKKQLEDTQAQVKAINEEWAGKMTAKEQEVFTTKVSGEVDRTMSRFRMEFRQDIEPTILEAAIEGRLTKFRTENLPKNVEGHIIYTDPQGVTRNSKTDGKPKNTEDILRELFADLFDKKRVQGGAGSGGDGGSGGGDAGAKWKNIQLPAEVDTKVKLYNYLTKTLKMAQDTKETAKEFSEAYENLGKNLRLK